MTTALIGTTIHDEEVHIVSGLRYETVTVDGIKRGGPFTPFYAAEFARSIVPTHRREVN
jgi:hypothetical protein